MTATTQRSALYTPEAVRVDLPLADVGSRSLALIIDLAIMLTALYFLLLIGFLGVGFAAAGLGDAAWPVLVAVLLGYFLVLWGYPTGCETIFGGRTAGKAALGLRVVTTDGAPIRFRHAAIRGLFAFVDFYVFLGIPALITALVTRKGQRLGDLAAGTVIIRDRSGGSPADRPVRWQVPSGLQAYAATLDVRGMTTADYALVRRFLMRAGSLRSNDRLRVGTDLANALAGRMHHQPPAGTHPEALLLCVAALLQGNDPARVPTPRTSGPEMPASRTPAVSGPSVGVPLVNHAGTAPWTGRPVPGPAVPGGSPMGIDPDPPTFAPPQ